MLDILSQLTPVFAYFAIGILLKRISLADNSHGDFILRFVFFVTLPLLVLTTLPKAPLSLDKALLPLANITVNLACMLLTLVVLKFRQLDRKTIGSMLIGTMIVNNSFMFPFILTIYGDEGFIDAVLFDFGNALMMSTFVYALAFRYGGEQHGAWTLLIKILKSPLVWSLFISVILSLTQTHLPMQIEVVAEPLAAMTAPLILIALGIFFSLNIADFKLVSVVVSIRMLFGLVSGMAVASLFGFEGTTFIVVSLCAAAPIGFMALTLSSLAKLDVQLTSSAVSFSILLGMLYIPVLMLLFGTP